MRSRNNSRHHRQPIARGGNGKPDNLSQIPRKSHEAWHTVFNDMCVPGIVILLNEWFINIPDYRVVFQLRDESTDVQNPCGTSICSSVCIQIKGKDIGKGAPHKQKSAWHTLFRGRDPTSVLGEINEIYIDQRYTLVLEPETSV